MNEKVILILVDGMASEATKTCTHPFVQEMLKDGVGNLYSTTVMPSVTLPCHMSLFHSVTPQRHGILSNSYVPQVRPIDGLVEQLKKQNKTSAFFYNWEELRDLSRAGSLSYSCFNKLQNHEKSDNKLTDKMIQYATEYSPDFVFLYLGETDEVGRGTSWESKEYHSQVYNAWSCIEKVTNALGNTYRIIVTADHGGHDSSHGTEDPRDMHIPIIISKTKTASDKLSCANIIDIAPTITAIMGVEANEYWQGTSLV